MIITINFALSLKLKITLCKKLASSFPSLADLNLYDVKKYTSILDDKYYTELTKAIGLSSHGIGVGSFVYLRRIFEHLIGEAHTVQSKSKSWNKEFYTKARMSERIQLLRASLPDFLVENKELYGILSKGIHELTEQECLTNFPVAKTDIELILDEKLHQKEKIKKLEDAKKAIQSVSKDLKP